jgi:hypothetical protein
LIVTPIDCTFAAQAATRWVVCLAFWMPLSVNCTKLMYVGLIFSSVPGVSFDLDSSSFEVPICGSSAKHNAAPKKQSANINPVVFVFMRPIESVSPFPVNISLFADKQPELLTRVAATEGASSCGQMEKCFTIETAGLGRFLHDRAVRWIPAKPVQLPPLLTPNF